ncbi:Acetyltransferase (GNAT) family protein [Caballeronia udeis]|uniref:Acetyltransferase (GNAT) family protein n=2 Tax=Caballeronia udeis TaxID=1232866 RepID=A0A158GBA9_9BURK|nr:Acetyltransferase (GNAT) family protein [Caballeronia udeis]
MCEIRRATRKDAKAVGKLVDLLFVELGGGKVDPCDRTDIAEHVLSAERSVFGFVAHQRDEMVGVILVNEGMAMYAGGRFGQITELYVKPEHRSAGVAARLVHEAIALGRTHGWHRMDVGAPHQPQWTRSLHFYLSIGFVEVGPRLRLDL